VDKDVVDAFRVPSIERQRNEVRVPMLASQGLSSVILPGELRASTELLLIANLAQQRTPEKGHRWKRPFHERKDIALLVRRECEQGRVVTIDRRVTRPPGH